MVTSALRLAVRLEQLAEVHAVELIAGQDQHVAGSESSAT